MGLTKCNSFCSPFWGSDCRSRKGRACECGKYASLSVSLEDQCIKEFANSGKFNSFNDWECANAEQIFVKLGIAVCNFDPNSAWLVQQKQNVEQQQTSSANTQKMILIGVILCFLAGILLLLMPKNNKTNG